MADDKATGGRADRDCINLNKDHEVRDWCEKFGCTSEELSRAVQVAGSVAKDVEAELSKRWFPGG